MTTITFLFAFWDLVSAFKLGKREKSMFEIKAILAMLAVIGVIGITIIAYKLNQVLIAVQELHRDISVIRLDNSRTMAELRRRHR